jgi:hypothetical protein
MSADILRPPPEQPFFSQPLKEFLDTPMLAFMDKSQEFLDDLIKKLTAKTQLAEKVLSIKKEMEKKKVKSGCLSDEPDSD